MTAARSKNIDIFVAKQIKESVSEPSSSNVYLTFGKSSSWPVESTPPQANTSVDAYNEVWKNMIGAKRVTGNNIRHAVPRFDWVSGSVYTSYDNTLDSLVLENANNSFFILTSDYNIYKCLSNNNSSTSTVMPTSTITTTHFQTSDGYIWKYMYTLSAEEKLRFLTPNFMPVKTLLENDNSTQWVVQENAVDGAIHVIEVTDGGSDYSANDVTVTITGDGTDANAYAIINTVSNTVQSIVVDNIGYNYRYATVTLSSSLGAGASARAIISPIGGHGSDPLTELGGSYLVFNIQFRNTEGGVLTTHNDYRQIALIEQPRVYDSTALFSNTVANQLTILNLNGTSVEYIEDEWVYQGSSLATAIFKGQVTEWDTGNNTIKLSQTQGQPTKDLLIGANTTAARFVSTITYPDIEPRSGYILYTDNITAIQRADDQAEDYKIILNF